jgi:sugar phosphate isomerase/epimerase
MPEPQLVATAWTSAGDTSPMRVPATSPVPITERVAAVAEAGFTGMGFIADDLLAVRDTIGFSELRHLISDHGLTHVEIELIERWWVPRGEAGNDAYRIELQEWIDSITKGRPSTLATVEDGLRASLVADALVDSMRICR